MPSWEDYDMPLYKYEGLTRDGSSIKGDYFAPDLASLKNDLAAQKIKLVSYSVMKAKKKSSFFSTSSRVSVRDFVTFVTQLSIMIKAGISIPNAFDTLRKQKFNLYFRNILSEVYEDVLKGMYLSDSLDKFPTVFPSFFTSMVYVGELSGNLAQVLDRSVAYYENDQKMKKKAKSAMIYPIFLLVIILGVFILMMVMVVPQFVEMIESVNGEIPLITKIIVALSDFVVNNIAIILIVLVSIVTFSLIFFGKTKAGKKAKDWIKFYFPIIRKVTRAQITSRFCTSFAILLASGMQVVDCMTSMPRIMDNAVFTNKFKQAITDVNEGEKLSVALEKTKLFPKILLQMTSVGESSSSLEDVYQTVGAYYEEELSTAISRATGMIEPITIIFLGVMVLVIILAIMLPMFSMMNADQYMA